MPRKKTAIARCLAAAAAILLLFAALPPAALARKVENPWKIWWADLGDRETKIEVPFLVLVSIAPMIAITPIWLGKLAVDAMESDD